MKSLRCALVFLLGLTACKLAEEKTENRRNPNPIDDGVTPVVPVLLPADAVVACEWLDGFSRPTDTESFVWFGCELKTASGERLTDKLTSVSIEAAGEFSPDENPGLRQGVLEETQQPDWNFLIPLPTADLRPWTSVDLTIGGTNNTLFKRLELDLSRAKAELAGPGEIAHEFAASAIRVSAEAQIRVTYKGAATARVTATAVSHDAFALKGGSWPGTGGTCGTEIRADCDIVVTYAPSALGNQSGALTVTYDTGLGSADLSLVLTGSGELAATGAVGQMSLIGSFPNQTGTPSASTLSRVSGVSHDGTRLVAADTNNNRVLIYPPDATTGTSATVVLGQDSMTAVAANRGGAVAANTLNMPRGVYSDGTRLFVADTGNHRVLIWNTIPTSNGVAADLVLGQTDMTSNSANRGTGVPDGTTLATPYALARSGTKLYVADTDNHRVLVWDTLPTTNGQTANIALGQADLLSGAVNRGGTPTAQTLNGPSSLWATGTMLLVGDRYNHRVLIWDGLPTTSGEAADQVLGQDDFVSGTPNAGEGAPNGWNFNQPLGVWSDGTRVVVGDTVNNRLLIWNEFPQINGESADTVFGQADFVTNVAIGQASPTLVRSAAGFAFHAGSLWIADTFTWSRILVLPLP